MSEAVEELECRKAAEYPRYCCIWGCPNKAVTDELVNVGFGNRRWMFWCLVHAPKEAFIRPH